MHGHLLDGGGQLPSFACKTFLNRPHPIQKDYQFVFSPVNIGFALNFAFLWFSDYFLFQIILRYVFCCRWPIGVFYLFPYFKQTTTYSMAFTFPWFSDWYWFRSKFRVFVSFPTFFHWNQCTGISWMEGDSWHPFLVSPFWTDHITFNGITFSYFLLLILVSL